MVPFDLQIVPERAESAHDDLVVRIGESEFICDTYYLVIDGAGAGTDPTRARRILGRLLDHWIGAVSDLAGQQPVCLPFDVSDQGTHWLCVRRSGTGVEFAGGRSLIEGHKLNPSDLGAYIHALGDWQQETPWHPTTGAELLARLRLIREREAV